MSAIPWHRAFVRRSGTIAIGLVLLILAIGSGAVLPAAADHSPLRPFGSSGPCSGASDLHAYSGDVRIDGAAPMPKVSLALSYDEELVTENSTGAVISTVCSLAAGTVAANSSGTFGFSIGVTPVVNCTDPPGGPAECTTVTAPYGSISVAPTSPNPLGYLSKVTQNGSAFHVLYYPALATVTLDPAGPTVTFSAGGVEREHAAPWTGLGSPSPASPTYNWTLSGVGWTYASPPSGDEATVSALPGAGIGTLSVVARLAGAGGTLVTPPAQVELLSVGTTISSADLNRSLVDVGQSMSAVVNGTGAAGYSYAATVTPGLNGSAVTTPCAASPNSDGTVAFSCEATLTYPGVGETQPTVTVSNGLSSAVSQLPDVTVDPAPSVAFLPALPVGYANATVLVSVEVGNGTGAAPFAEGCLAAGSGPAVCLASPGPSWTFAPVYTAPGSYSALAWAIDATGTNRSAATSVRIVAPLRVALSGNGSVATAGSPISLGAEISGGDLPARVWWNATGASNPLTSEWVNADGAVNATFVPSVAGLVTVSISVVDGLGTVAESSATYTVGLGAASSVVPVGPPPTASVQVGLPVTLAWQALDPADEVVNDFASAAEIELTTGGSSPSASPWVNASGVGPLASASPGSFDVPAAAWIGGTLNVSITSREAGVVALDLVVSSGISVAGGPVNVTVLPDLDHLRLFDPDTVVGSARSNDTLWQVTDRFGNPAAGASVTITTTLGSGSTGTVASVFSEPNGGTAVWANFTAPGALAGTVRVTDAAGDLLFAPIAVPGSPGSPTLGAALLPLLLAIGLGAGIGAAVYLRGRRAARNEVDEPEDDEAALQRLAEGRTTVVEIVRRAGPLDLAGLAAAWGSP
ncbi:MAG: hypothetical protein WB873_02985, partial [Thermoplasmata archaeon]